MGQSRGSNRRTSRQAFAAPAGLLRSLICGAALAAALVCAGGSASAQGIPGIPPVRNPAVEAVALAERVTSLAAVPALARDRQGAIVTNRVLASILGGFNEQINCTTCISAFGEVGSFSGGIHGRHAITDDLSVIGGIAYATTAAVTST